MGFRFNTFITKQALNALPPNGTETILYQTAPMILAADGAAVFVTWWLDLSPGAGEPSFTVRIRRGTTIAGQQIGVQPWNVQVLPVTPVLLSGCYVDVFALSDSPYVLTVTQTNSTTAAQIQDGCLHAFVL